MKNIYFLALLSLLVVACNSNPSTTSSVSLASVEKTTTTPFTDTLKLDTFKVRLEGTNSKTCALVFTIKAYNGKEIYRTTLKATDLLKANENLKTESDKMKFLKNEVEYFFEEEHFLWPAVIPTEQPDKNVRDKVFYEELKETKLNGFNYRLGKEAKVYIAYSLKEQKVKPYYELK